MLCNFRGGPGDRFNDGCFEHVKMNQSWANADVFFGWRCVISEPRAASKSRPDWIPEIDMFRGKYLNRLACSTFCVSQT